MAGVRGQGSEIVNWQIWRAACWPYPPKNPRGKRQICRIFDRFTGRATDFYPDFNVVVMRHCDRRLACKSAYIKETGVMIGYMALPTELLIQIETLSRLEAAALMESQLEAHEGKRGIGS